MLDESVVHGCSAAALRTGGEFAEVFVEDKRSSSARARRRQGRGAHAPGRDRGAGIRVVVGETTGFAHTADLSEPGLRVRRRGGGRRGPRRRRRRAHRGARPRRTRPAPERRAVLPGDVAKATKVELLQRADEAARAVGGAIKQVSARYGDSRRRILVANSDGLLAGDDQVRTLFSVPAVAAGDTGMQTGSRPSATPSASSCSTATTSRTSPAGPPSRRSPSSRPARRRRARCPS